jgi:uncharacterized protein (TIGR02117 family)
MKIAVTFLLLTLLYGCSTKPYVVGDTPISVTTPQEISIVSHGWHTGFVIPAETIISRLPQLKKRFPNTPFIEFGWGDKGFYQAKEITSGLTVQAIFWPTESVVHAVSVPKKAELYFSNSDVQIICLNKKQYSQLVAFIENSFLKDTDGNIIKLKNGIYGNSQFYRGEGDYYLMNTCNKWTAKGLKSAELDISTTFKLTASSIMDYLVNNNQVLTNHSCVTGEQNPLSPQF